MEDVAFSQAMKRRGPPACLRSGCAPRAGAGRRAACCAPSLLMWRLRLLYCLGARPERARANYTAMIQRCSSFPARRCRARVKTRLVPRLGEWRAARLHARLTRRALRTARDGGVRAGRAACRPRSTRLWLAEDISSAERQRPGRAHVSRAAPPPRRDPDRRRLPGAAAARPAARGALARAAATTWCWRRRRTAAMRSSPRRRVSRASFDRHRVGRADGLRDTVRNVSRWDTAGARCARVWDVDRPEDLERLRWLRFSSAARRCVRR